MKIDFVLAKEKKDVLILIVKTYYYMEIKER